MVGYVSQYVRYYWMDTPFDTYCKTIGLDRSQYIITMRWRESSLNSFQVFSDLRFQQEFDHMAKPEGLALFAPNSYRNTPNICKSC